MKRRDFLSRVAAVGVSAGAAAAAAAKNAPKPEGQLPRRPYGKTGRELSIVALGGIVISEVPQEEANSTVAWAFERGVTYYDVAPTYGNAQERLGPALKPYRDRVFLACKTTQRDAAGAQGELEESLRLLQTDHLDLYQLHGLTKPNQVDTVMGPGGAMETFTKARDKGQVRYLGFSAHSVEAALKALDAFPFDSVLFPLNVVCVENGDFGPQVLKKAREKGAAVLALKAMAWTPRGQEAERKFPKCWYQPISDPDLARLALSYTLDLPVVAAVPPGDPGLFRIAVEAGLKYKPLRRGERRDLLARAKGVEPIFRHTA